MSEDNHSEMVEAITDALRDGKKIQAIKIYCDATGKRLREAKEFIDQLIPELIEKDPEQFGHLASKGAGCGSAVLLALLTSAFFVAVFQRFI